jgi:hypothetical protein
MNRDGTGLVQVTSNSGTDEVVDWQPILRGYPRPKGATPFSTYLVPAYEPCSAGAANRTHGGSLSYPSCNPASQVSDHLTLGTFDANGKMVQSIGFVRADAIVGNPGTPADEADLRLRADISDVRKASDLADYTGELRAQFQVRITDKDSTPYPGGAGPGTVSDLLYAFTVPCAATPDPPSVGSSCVVDTTADALAPGTIKEQKRSIWELSQIEVYDGGADGLASTTADNTLFEVQGVFVP